MSKVASTLTHVMTRSTTIDAFSGVAGIHRPPRRRWQTHDERDEQREQHARRRREQQRRGDEQHERQFGRRQADRPTIRL